MIEGLARLDVPELEPTPAVRGDEATVSVTVARGTVPQDTQLHERHLAASRRARSKRSSTKQVLAKKTSKEIKEENAMTRARRERAAAQRAKAAARAHAESNGAGPAPAQAAVSADAADAADAAPADTA